MKYGVSVCYKGAEDFVRNKFVTVDRKYGFGLQI